MINYNELKVLPAEFQTQWQAQLHKAQPAEKGAFRLVSIHRTQPKSYQELKVIVLVIDENGFPMPGIKVAFSYDTAHPFVVGQDFEWTPPFPFQADISTTDGGGQAEHIQGSVVKQGQPGGITVYCVEPEYSSDYVSGAGALADHSGMYLVMQLRRPDVVPLADRLAAIEERLAVLEGKSS